MSCFILIYLTFINLHFEMSLCVLEQYLLLQVPKYFHSPYAQGLSCPVYETARDLGRKTDKFSGVA